MSKCIARTFNHYFVLSRRQGGHFYALHIQKTEGAIRFLNDFSPYACAFPSMRKKLDWEYRVQLERENHLDMNVMSFKAKHDYTQYEIEFIIQAKQEGMTDTNIAKELNRLY